MWMSWWIWKIEDDSWIRSFELPKAILKIEVSGTELDSATLSGSFPAFKLAARIHKEKYFFGDSNQFEDRKESIVYEIMK